MQRFHRSLATTTHAQETQQSKILLLSEQDTHTHTPYLIYLNKATGQKEELALLYSLTFR